MKRLRSLIGLLFACCVLVPAFAAPGDDAFERGYSAYEQRNYPEAASAWREAAALGHARAQNGLGVLYQDGAGVRKDLKEAARWFLESASRGYAFGMYNLALMYRDGTGLMPNDVEAYKWIQLAIDYANDDVLDHAATAACNALFVGFNTELGAEIHGLLSEIYAALGWSWHAEVCARWAPR